MKIQRLLQHDNLLGIKRVMLPKDKNFDEIYIVADYMDTDLSKVINSQQDLSIEHIRFFLY